MIKPQHVPNNEVVVVALHLSEEVIGYCIVTSVQISNIEASAGYCSFEVIQLYPSVVSE